MRSSLTRNRLSQQSTDAALFLPGGSKWDKEKLAKKMEEGANTVKAVYRCAFAFCLSRRAWVDLRLNAASCHRTIWSSRAFSTTVSMVFGRPAS